MSLTQYAERARSGEPKTVATDSRRLQAKLRQSLIIPKERREVGMTGKIMIEGEFSYCCRGTGCSVETVLLVFRAKQWEGKVRSEHKRMESEALQVNGQVGSSPRVRCQE